MSLGSRRTANFTIFEVETIIHNNYALRGDKSLKISQQSCNFFNNSWSSLRSHVVFTLWSHDMLAYTAILF